LQSERDSFIIDAMEAAKTGIEPQFLSQALSQGAKLRIGQMNKTEHEGVLRDIGRYEINLEERSGIVTILKQDISFLSSSATVLDAPAPQSVPAETAPAAGSRPNIQQEFLDKAIRERHAVTIYLLTGQRIRAVIEAYDNFTLLLRDGERQHLYYKHAVSTINR
jgi:host factor-I protein